MKRSVPAALGCAVLLSCGASGGHAQVRVERRGAENPMVEVYRSTLYGGLVGLLLGGAVALATEDDDQDGDVIRWSIVAGTFFGFAYGLYHVHTRPQPSGLLELRQGELRAGVPTVESGPGPPGVRLHMLAARF